MDKPRIFVHLILDQTTNPSWSGAPENSDRFLALNEVLRQETNVKSQAITPAIVSNFRIVTENLIRLLSDTYCEFPIQLRNDYSYRAWENLDIIVFQSKPDNVDAQNADGVEGHFHEGAGTGNGFRYAPYIMLSAIPGCEERIKATAVHEFGHFLRSRATWKTGDLPFGHRVFEEGLCESLVEQKLGMKHVFHKGDISKTDLQKLDELLEKS